MFQSKGPKPRARYTLRGSSSSTTSAAGVQLDRLSQQLKKRLRQQSASNRWTGLGLVALCLISFCYVAMWAVSSAGDAEKLKELNTLASGRKHGHVHPGELNENLLDADPEHWPQRRQTHLPKADAIDKDIPPPPARDGDFKDEMGKVRNGDKSVSDTHAAVAERRGRGRLQPRDLDSLMQNDLEEDTREQREDAKEKLRQQRREEVDGDYEDDDFDDGDFLADDELEEMERELERREAEVAAEEMHEKEHFDEDDDSEQMDEEIILKPGSNWAKIADLISDVPVSFRGNGNDAMDESEKAHSVKMAFAHAWHGYASHALGHDEIKPVSDLPGDSWGGLGATLIDALDTLQIMGLDKELQTAKDALRKISFDVDFRVSFFETTIRHLGGLLGAYELSRTLQQTEALFLEKARELADRLLPAFDTPLGVPKSLVNLRTAAIKNYDWTRDMSVLAEVASNQMEFYALSHLTGDRKYYEASSKVLALLRTAERSDGMYARLIDPETGEFPSNERVYSVGGMADSFYEYLLKLWVLSTYKDTSALRMYVDAIEQVNDQLLHVVFDNSRRESQPFFFYGELWYGQFRGKTEELTCFMPGVLALGAFHARVRFEKAQSGAMGALTESEKRLLSASAEHLKLAHVLAESCYQLYQQMPTKLAPESIEFDSTQWSVREARYQLRPETVESLYVLYSVTGNQVYREWAWNIFTAIEKYCRTHVAFSGLRDVREVPPEMDNKMESYVLAETFKYLYLIFDSQASELLPLETFVFNTEAHAFKQFDADFIKPEQP